MIKQFYSCDDNESQQRKSMNHIENVKDNQMSKQFDIIKDKSQPSLQQSVHIIVEQKQTQAIKGISKIPHNEHNEEQQIQNTRSIINIHVVESKDTSLMHFHTIEEQKNEEQNMRENKQTSQEENRHSYKEMSLVCIDLYSEQEPIDRKYCSKVRQSQKNCKNQETKHPLIQLELATSIFNIVVDNNIEKVISKQCCEELKETMNNEQGGELEIRQQSESYKADGLSEQQYERIIDELSQKLMRLKMEYEQLIQVNDELIELREQCNEIIEGQITIENTNPPFEQIDSISKSPLQFNINKVYDYTLIVAKNMEKQNSNKIEKQYPTENHKQQTGDNQPQKQIVNCNTNKQDENSEHQQMINIQHQQVETDQQYTIYNNHQDQGVVPCKSQQIIKQEQEKEKEEYDLGILTKSIFNLATVKQSIDTLSYQRIAHIMSLQWLTSKISFKQKHYPSQSSTPQQLKLYGKRLFKLLINTNTINNININTTNNHSKNQEHSLHQVYRYSQNDIEYEQNDHYVTYFIKQIKHFIIICYYNKTIYIGPYITQSNEPIRQGHGIQIRQHKYLYQGQFHSDKKHGYGCIHFQNTKNPKIHCGYWIDGFIDGNGKQIYQNGQTYQGQFKLGFRDGLGHLYYKDDKLQGYQGQFYDGFKHGNGFQKFLNQDTYTGSYIKDKFHGQGQYQWKNGTIYKGTFHEGQKHGQGLLIFTNGKQFQKYYDHNRQINIRNDDDEKRAKSSTISNITQSKIEEKHSSIQEKQKIFRNYRSESGKSLFSTKSLSKEKSLKNIKSKKNIAQIIKHKQLEQDLKNLNAILKPSEQQRVKKIFSIKKMDQTQNVKGKIYNISDRPAMKLSEHNEIDMLKLGRTGCQGKSLISFDSQERLQELKESNHRGLGYNMTNFSQF